MHAFHSVVCLSVCLLFGGLQAMAADSSVVNFAATNGTEVSLSYDVVEKAEPMFSQRLATNMVVRVSNRLWNSSHANRDGRVVLLSYCHHENLHSEDLEYSQQLSIPYFQTSNGGFYELKLATTPWANELVLEHSGHGGHYLCRQELAAVIDGVWLIDPVNGSHNFKMELR